MGLNYKNKIKDYLLLMRLHKPIGILLTLWPTLCALLMAGQGKPQLKNLTIFILGVIVMRSAGCVINDIADRNLDTYVTRTKNRPLASGAVTLREAVILFALLILFAFILVLLLNQLTVILAFICAVLTLIYPFMKRYTHFPQVILGFAFNWGVVMAFAAELNSVPAIAWLFFLIACIWTLIYDTFYAMVDRADDIKIGIKSTAILFGSWDRFITASLQVSMLFLLIYLGWSLNFGQVYYTGCFIITLLFIYQQYLIKTRETQRCFKAFLNNNWVGMVLCLSILSKYL